MLFSKEFLIDGIFDKKNTISETLCDTSRWSISYKRIFKFEDKYYRTFYNTAATECQDESPYEYEDDQIECEEVFPTEVKVIKYLSKKELENLNASN